MKTYLSILLILQLSYLRVHIEGHFFYCSTGVYELSVDLGVYEAPVGGRVDEASVSPGIDEAQ